MFKHCWRTTTTKITTTDARVRVYFKLTLWGWQLRWAKKKKKKKNTHTIKEQHNVAEFNIDFDYPYHNPEGEDTQTSQTFLGWACASGNSENHPIWVNHRLKIMPPFWVSSCEKHPFWHQFKGTLSLRFPDPLKSRAPLSPPPHIFEQVIRTYLSHMWRVRANSSHVWIICASSSQVWLIRTRDVWQIHHRRVFVIRSYIICSGEMR